MRVQRIGLIMLGEFSKIKIGSLDEQESVHTC